MTYKLNPEIGKIESPVKIIWNGKRGNGITEIPNAGESQCWMFENGKEAVDAVFEQHFNVTAYRANGSTIEIEVYEFMEPSAK
ncbi:MAG: hypothetical protein IJ242_18015 [Clostridia bacterium]|nr:hypothetical protein [Clostridia bacterium]